LEGGINVQINRIHTFLSGMNLNYFSARSLGPIGQGRVNVLNSYFDKHALKLGDKREPHIKADSKPSSFTQPPDRPACIDEGVEGVGVKARRC
jgi:hypothetical protein